MKLLKFDANKILNRDMFRQNSTIEPIYLQIAEMVIVKLYKAFSFNAMFYDFNTKEEKSDSFKFAIVDWADCFMSWGIDNLEHALETVNDIIYINITPTLGLFRAAYFNENIIIENSVYKEYVNYLYKFAHSSHDGRINGAKIFSIWLENKND